VRLIDQGSGPPVVLVPGIQGRWEWMRPAVDALAKRCRVITFSLADEPTCGARFDEAQGFWCYVEQITEAMDASGLEQATICGVSYGGLIAAGFAARHPDRVSALALVSAIPPSWIPDPRVRELILSPRLMTPLFCIGSVRIVPEIVAARGGWIAGLLFSARHGIRTLTNIFSPTLMARRVRLVENLNLEPEIRGIDRPTLIITGEPGLDRVVPVQMTREYLQLVPHAKNVTIPRTGHLGLVTKPEVFADLVASFAIHAEADSAPKRRAGRFSVR
jgi:pimeloyl-ACP methyl ester carboxylesterase